MTSGGKLPKNSKEQKVAKGRNFIFLQAMSYKYRYIGCCYNGGKIKENLITK